MAGINSQNQLGYATLETIFGQAVPPTASAFKVTQLNTVPSQETIQRPDKNSSLSQTLGIGGVKSGTWSARMALPGSAGAGTAPDIGPILQAAFGKAPVVVPSTSVTYQLDDFSPSLSIWSYWKPADATQYVAIGSVVAQMSLDVGATGGTLEFSGPALWALDTDQFANADAIAKGGLASFPPEPASPVTTGNMITTFAGSVVIDGDNFAEVRTFRLTAALNREIPTDVIFAGQYGASPSQNRRDITFDMNIYDKAGDVDFSGLKDKAIRKVPMPVVITIGNAPGHTVVLDFGEVLIGIPNVDDGAVRKAITFNGSRAHASSGTAKDELTMAWK